ncbi:ABC transporter permease [Deinococcus peraridilitoris]|uniref:ABC-type dipeptide/oligopeptide/nickel transport system, permease component n=1 Tax=Deinococcus peraridilitoris (strain DSM 19664 / LMG 22246 / CIP 109416 / KR-200) TaxID=937777 RepID=K9ZVQ4_DEIPD|nr:ABC transporter permease [Deinococcus peraridilitoris]AFZ65698.1 ABC-type dipeptide/oligopeptide/nickel transport system, permease component [Deinococcus peraridilitoris DSM 19664]
MPYLLRKFGILLFTLWVAVTLNFILPRLVPGDPIGAMLAKYQGRLDPSAVDALKIAYGLNDQGSVVSQYFTYLGKTVRGDFGRSIGQFPTPVWDIVAQAAPWTIGLIGVCTVLSFLLGSALGLYSAWRRGSRLADALPPLALFLNSMPYFWFALLLLYLLAFKYSFFPLSGSLDPFLTPYSAEWWSSLLRHAVLPALTIIVTAAGGWLITMRNNVMSVMSEDYIAFARAKGLSESRLLNRYVLRNALLPSFTAFGMALGFVVGGSILTEVVFSYPGLGLQLFNAVTTLDYPLMQAIFLFIALAVLIANFFVDALYAVLDPRVRDGKTA